MLFPRHPGWVCRFPELTPYAGPTLLVVKAAKDYVGDGFRIEYRWKEEVVYWEGDRGFLLDAGWGVDLSVLYVPSPEVGKT